MDDPTASHLDDEALSAAVDAGLGAPAPDDAAVAHLADCAACGRRRDALAEARNRLEAAPVESPDEFTRRRLIARALAEAPPAGAAQPRRPWYLRPAVAGGVAAALLAVLAAVPLLSRPEADRQETALKALAEVPFLGDLGELSDPAVLRSTLGGGTFSEAGEGAARTGGDDASQGSAGAAESAPVPAASPYAPAPAPPTEADQPAAGSVEKLRRDELTARAPAVLDRAVTEECATVLANGPARGGRLVATAVGTYRGTPAVVAAFARGSRTTVYLAARHDCRVLDSYRL